MLCMFLATKERSELGFHPISEIPRYQPVDITDYLQQLDGDVRDYTMQLQSEKWVTEYMVSASQSREWFKARIFLLVD